MQLVSVCISGEPYTIPTISSTRNIWFPELDVHIQVDTSDGEDIEYTSCHTSDDEILSDDMSDMSESHLDSSTDTCDEVLQRPIITIRDPAKLVGQSFPMYRPRHQRICRDHSIASVSYKNILLNR